MAKSDKATVTEAQSGTDDSKWMTPTKTKSLINAVLESSGVKIRRGSYTGTGTTPLVLDCLINPKLIFISTSSDPYYNGFMTGPGTYGAGSFVNSLIWNGSGKTVVTYNKQIEYDAIISISGTTIRHYISDRDCPNDQINSYDGYKAICNCQGYVYNWIALG